MNVVDIYGYNASERCAAKPQCRKNINADAWHQWINKDIDVNHAFESLASKYLYAWLSLAARKMHGLSDKGHAQPLKLYEEYPMISPLDIASAFGQITYIHSCRLRWNQRYLDATGVWQLKPIFNSSHVEVINSSYLLNLRTCRMALKQFRFIVDNSPRQSLPEYMDVIYQFGDFPKMPLSHLFNSDEPNNHRSQAASLLPYWLTSKGGFLGGIDYYTVNYTIPLLNIPPPMLSHCTTDQHIDIPWFYFDKWLEEPIDQFLKALSVKKTQVEDCSSVCDTSSEWHTRRPQAAWQGSLTDTYRNIKLAGNWRHHQRVVLREQGIQHPDILDIQLVYCSACSNETRHALMDTLGAFVDTDRRHIHRLDAGTCLYYQGLIDIDGVTWSSRLYQLLTRGAVVFKQHSQYKEWWSDLLIPGTHYVSLSYDMLDTASIVQSTLADEERCQLIALNGVQFAATYLRLESWLKYSQIFLRAYSALLIKPWQKLSHMDIHYLFEHGDRIRQEHKKFS
jgi:hypothetical protein